MTEGKEMLIHVIEAEDIIREFPGSSRLNNDWDFLYSSARNWPRPRGQMVGRQP